jgi:hypothetical protein
MVIHIEDKSKEIIKTVKRDTSILRTINTSLVLAGAIGVFLIVKGASCSHSQTQREVALRYVESHKNIKIIDLGKSPSICVHPGGPDTTYYSALTINSQPYSKNSGDTIYTVYWKELNKENKIEVLVNQFLDAIPLSDQETKNPTGIHELAPNLY